MIFWPFRCDSWQKALPELCAFHARHEELHCAVWTENVEGTFTEGIRPCFESKKIPFPVLLDDGSCTGHRGLRRVPTVLVFDRLRKVAWQREADPGNALLERVERKMK